MNLTDKEIQEFEYYFKSAGSLSKGLTILKGNPETKIGFWNRRKIRKAIRLYYKCLAIRNNHWQTHWLIGKLYQVLKENEKAFDHFKVAVEIEDDNPEVAREASIAAMDIGKVELAVSYSLEALNRNPEDYSLYCNHALNLMIIGKDKDSLTFIDKAISMGPNDPINKYAFRLISEVINGQRIQLKYNELE